MVKGFKILALSPCQHVQEIILPKNMFSCPLKLIMGFFGIFYVFGYIPKFSYIIMYECETHHCHMNYFKLNYSIFFI
jgi:hypothetical protein